MTTPNLFGANLAGGMFGNLRGAAAAVGGDPSTHGATPVASPPPPPPPPAGQPAAGRTFNPLDPFGSIRGALDDVRGGLQPPPPPPPPPGRSVPPGLSVFPGFPPIGTTVPFPPPGIAWPGRDVVVPAGPIERHAPYTQLAQRAIALLRGASREALMEAMERARGKQVPADRLIDWIERKTRIGEVLGGPASGWSADTVNDFAAAFQMQPGKPEVMDVLAALGLLNWPDLDGEIREENTSAPTEGDMLQNRRVVYQYPPPGTPLEPPYVVVVAVEHQDMRRAEETVASITGGLVASNGFRMPREAAAKVA